MSFKVYGKELEGQNPREIFPHTIVSSDSDIRYRIAQLRKYLDAGGRFMVEIIQGARKGTIGEVVVPPGGIDDLYDPMVRTGLGDRRKSRIKEFEIKFDDRATVIKVPMKNWTYAWPPCVMRFGLTETQWVYTTKERPKVDPVVIRDHFSVVLEVGQVVLFLYGSNNTYENRFGKISRISDKGTIWVEAFKTREGQFAGEIHQGVHGSSMFVLDGDLRDKAMMARLSLE